jgi:hypothetical protein
MHASILKYFLEVARSGSIRKAAPAGIASCRSSRGSFLDRLVHR